jgi:hypothetical protein
LETPGRSWKANKSKLLQVLNLKVQIPIALPEIGRNELWVVAAGFRKLKFIDKQQQLRFSMELALYAMLFPLFFRVLSLADPIATASWATRRRNPPPLFVARFLY